MFALGPARIPQGQQFPTGARINGSHPLAQGLGFLAVAQGQLAYDLVGGTAAALTGALTQKTVRSGQALAFPGNSTNRLTWPTQTSTSWKNASDWTLCVLGRMLEADYASSNLYPVLVKHTSGSSDLSVGFEDVSGDMRFSIQIDATGSSQPGSVSIGTAGGTNSLGLVGAQTALYTWRLSGTTLDCFINGALVDTKTVLAHGANVAAAIGTANTGDAIGANGAIQAWYVYNRRLDQNEIAQLSAFPWCMFANVAAPDPYLFDGGSASGSTGTVAYTNANDTLVASGTTTILGALATTNANDTSAASGTTTILGTLARTNANDTSAASGTTTVLGTLAKTNADDTVVASGSVGAAVSGTLATTNANDTLAASGTTTILGTLAKTNANDSLAANGTTTVLGSLAYTNANDSVVASGAAGSVTGSLAYTNANDTLAAFGTASGAVSQLGGRGKNRREPSIEEWAEFAEYRDVLRQARKELEKPQPSVAKVERAIEVLVTPTFEVPEYETRLEDLRNLAEVAEISRRFQRIVGEYLAMLQDEEDVEILLH